MAPPAALLAPREPCWSPVLKTALIGSHRHLRNPYLCFWRLRKEAHKGIDKKTVRAYLVAVKMPGSSARSRRSRGAMVSPIVGASS